MTVGSLFSGIGGLELGLEMCGIGPVIWQAECDPAALAVLSHHWPAVRRYTDVRGVDARATRVDVVCGGFPCQPHSLAGKRKGTADARWLWPEFVRVIANVRPSFVFIENVPGLRTSGLRNVLADLACLGFNAEWDYFSAEEVGAPHRRKRIFILAYSDRQHRWIQPGRRSWENGTDTAIASNDGSYGTVADADGERQLQPSWPVGYQRGWAGNGSEPLAHAAGSGLEGRQQPEASRPSLGEFAGDGGTRNPWSVEPDVGRVANGVPARAHRLRLLGNAVVPQQAALAWRTLAARLS